MVGRAFALIVSLLLGLAFSASAEAEVVLLEGEKRGLGYAFCDSNCAIVAPLHLLGGKFADSRAESFRVTGQFGSMWGSSPSRAANAYSERLDVMMLETSWIDVTASDRSVAQGADSHIPPISSTSLMFREGSGLLEFIPVSVRAEDADGYLAISSTPGESCRFQEGRSGALLVSEQHRILGMLTKVTDACVGRVLPVDQLNGFLETYEQGSLPSHTYSNELLNAARCTNEEAFFGLVSSGADPHAFGSSGHMSLERIVTTYGIGLGCRVQSPPRQGREEFSSEKQYREYLRTQQQIECKEINARRLRMIDVLSRLEGFRVEGLGGHRWTPLMSAVASEPGGCSNDQLVQKLMDLGADPDHRWNSKIAGRYSRPLDLAIHEGTSNSVLMLLGAGADPNLPDDRGLNAAMRIVVDRNPSEHIGDQEYSGGCWEETDETHLTKKLEYLVGHVDLGAVVPHHVDGWVEREFSGLTVKQILLKRLNCEDANEDCYAVPRTADGRCLEKMLSKLP